MSENEVRILIQKMDTMAEKMEKMSNEVTGIKTTVGLLVEGKIKTTPAGDPALSKVTMSAMRIIEIVVAGLIGAITAIFAGKGGTN